MQLIISENKKLQKGYIQDVAKHDASYESNAEDKNAKERLILSITWNDLGSTVNIMLNSGVFSSNKATMTAADS